MAQTFLFAIAILIFARVAVAQTTSSLPSCAQTCFGNSFGSCSQLDIKCICSNSDFASSLQSCVQAACNADDQQATYSYAESLCLATGVTLSFSVATATSSSSTPVPTSAVQTTLATTTSDGATSAAALSSLAATASRSSQTATATTAESDSLSASAAAASSSSSSSSAASASSSSSFSAGAAAGLGVGVTLGVVAIAAIGGFFLWRRLKRARAAASHPSNASPDRGDTDKEVTTMSANEPWKSADVYYEADGNPRGELEDRHGTGIARERRGTVEFPG